MTKADALFKSYREDLMNRVKEGNEKALIELGINITGLAKNLAPVDFGQLRNSIQWQTAKSSGGYVAGHNTIGENSEKQYNGNPDGRNGFELNNKNNDLLVGATAKHAIYQEFGTRNMKPQPFMRPAIQRFTRGTNTMKKIAQIVNNWVVKTEKNKAIPK